MSRHQHPVDQLDPLLARELADLEAALAGTPTADPLLSALVREVREDAATPSPAFRSRLDERAAAGFP
ncbi:MAG: hypothetical protein JWM31_2084, partial [Solirubrobacterales bacterium]|nr:hypothetical protein [Solirubrobacterales bacterium]